MILDDVLHENIKLSIMKTCETIKHKVNWFGWIMMFNSTFNTISAISWRSVLLLGEIGMPGENH